MVISLVAGLVHLHRGDAATAATHIAAAKNLINRAYETPGKRPNRKVDQLWFEWADVSQGAEIYPPFVVNPQREAELALFSHSWIGGDLSPKTRYSPALITSISARRTQLRIHQDEGRP